MTSLEDYDDYRQLAAKKQFILRYRYPLACAPLILGLDFVKHAVENSVVFFALIGAWMAVFIVYVVVINIRFLDFKCPQCSDKFGSEDECITCGFPRSAMSDRR